MTRLKVLESLKVHTNSPAVSDSATYNAIRLAGCSGPLKKMRLYSSFVIDNNEKFRSLKSKENIHKIEVGPYRGFSY